MLTKGKRVITSLLLLFFSAVASASCTPGALAKESSDAVTARVTSMLGRSDYVIEIVQPQGVNAACLVFRSHPASRTSDAVFELALPGQLGLHVVTLGQDYLVVESGTATGSFMSEIFAIKLGKPTRLTLVGSKTPPNFVRRGERDYVLTIDEETGQERRTQL